MAFIELMIKLNKNLESKQMGKQTYNQTKKILSILLIVFFVAAVTAPAISADRPHHHEWHQRHFGVSYYSHNNDHSYNSHRNHHHRRH